MQAVCEGGTWAGGSATSPIKQVAVVLFVMRRTRLRVKHWNLNKVAQQPGLV